MTLKQRLCTVSLSIAALTSPAQTCLKTCDMASFYSAKEARSKNYGGKLIVSRANYSYGALLKFDLSFAQEKRVEDAMILLYSTKQYHSRPARINVYEVLAPWKQDEVNYLNRRADAPWTRAGGDVAEVPVASFDLEAKYINGWVAVKSPQLTGMINDWLTGKKPNNGVMMRCAFKFKGATMKFFGDQKRTPSDKLPKLILSVDQALAPADWGVISPDQAQRAEFCKRLDRLVAQAGQRAGNYSLEIKEINNLIKSLRADDKARSGLISEAIERLRMTLLQEEFPGRNVKAWALGPWDSLAKEQFPTKEPAAPTGTMLSGEFLELSFAVTNLTPKKQTLSVTLDPAGFPADKMTLRASYWVSGMLEKKLQKPGRNHFRWVDDALPLLDENRRLLLKPGESRRVWITLDSRGVKPGDYKMRLALKELLGGTTAVPVRVTVLAQELERDPKLHVYTYAYLNRRSTDTYRKTAIKDLKEHYQNTYVLNLLPEYDVQTGKADFSKIIDYLKLIPDAKKVLFFWNCECGKVPFCPAADWKSAEWKQRLQQVMRQWYEELAQAGFPKVSVRRDLHQQLLRPHRIRGLGRCGSGAPTARSRDPDVCRPSRLCRQRPQGVVGHEGEYRCLGTDSGALSVGKLSGLAAGFHDCR
jgi:hypothetical protein